MPTFTRISWILMSRDWFMVMWKEATEDCTWSCRIRAFYFGEDTILRLGWIGSFYLEVCYVLTERITVLSLKLGSLVLSCLWTQRGCKEHEVQKTVSENRLRVCVLFKIHLLILPALYHVSVIKCQIHPSHWEISPAIKMPLHLFSGIEDIQPFCVASLSTLSTPTLSTFPFFSESTMIKLKNYKLKCAYSIFSVWRDKIPSYKKCLKVGLYH